MYRRGGFQRLSFAKSYKTFRKGEQVKKITGIVCIALFIVSCGDFVKQEPGKVTIINTSSFDVTYTFGGWQEKIIKTIANGGSDEGPTDCQLYDYMKSYKPSRWVSLKTEYPQGNDVVCTFSDKTATHHFIKVINTTGQNVTLSARDTAVAGSSGTSDSWMVCADSSSPDYLVEDIALTPDTAEQPDSIWSIYTDTPNFKAVFTDTGFPAGGTDYIFDETSNTFLVTVW